MSGGSNNQLLDTGLMVAAGIAAPEVALAVAPEMMATTGGAALATGIAGGTLGGLAAGVTGQNVGQGVLMGGLGGAAGGYFGGPASTTQTFDPLTQTATQASAEDAGTQAVKNAIVQNPSYWSSETPLSKIPDTIHAEDLGSLPSNLRDTYGQAFSQTYQNAINAGAGTPTATSLTQSTMIPGISKAGLIGGTTAGIGSLLSAPQPTLANIPGTTYTGPLSKFKYDPTTYQPDVVVPPSPRYRAQYAQGGGIKDLMEYSNGGISQLAVGGRLLQGQGDGMSDSIKANISGKQEARLADGEFVVPADVVSHLGNGSTDAGAKQLYAMMDKVRQARVGTKKQGKQINPRRYMPV